MGMSFKIIVCSALLLPFVVSKVQKTPDVINKLELLEEIVNELEDDSLCRCPSGMRGDCPCDDCEDPAVACGDYCCQWASVEGCDNICCDNGDCGCTQNNCDYGMDAVFLSIVEKIKKRKCEAGNLEDCNDCKGLSAQCDNGMCCRCSGGGCICCDDGVTCSWSDYDCSISKLSNVFTKQN